MIVQPVPAERPGRRRRAIRAMAVAVPVLLLGAIVTAGMLGSGRTAPSPAAPGDALASRPPDPVASPSPGAGAEAMAFPTIAANLAVLTVAEAADRVSGDDQGPFAVAGYLAEVGPYSPCAAADADPRGDLGPLCLRHGRLQSTAAGDRLWPAVDLLVGAGARLPAELERTGGPGRPVPIVLVGRRGARTDPCHPTPDLCGGLMVVERVTWADGEEFEPGPVFDAWLDAGPPALPLLHLDAAERQVTDGEGTILQAVLLHPATVAMVDADAGRAMARSGAHRSIVWYVRGVQTGYHPGRDSLGFAPPRYAWVVVDYATGATIASGPPR